MQQAARSAVLICLALSGPGPARGEQHAGEGGLFESHEVLRLQLAAPLGVVIRGARRGIEERSHAGVLQVDGHAIPIQISAFGKTRLSVCGMAPLKMLVDVAGAAGTVFEGEEILRLVPDCGVGRRSEQLVLLEYLVYRMWGMLTEPALSVRLAEIDYRDSDGKGLGGPNLAFFVEDINRAAARHGLEWLAIEGQNLDDLDAAEVSLFTLFQFAMGNTDWSVLEGPKGERCCHNVAVLGRPEGGRRRLLPFDFDSSGIVDAPYAAPEEALGITRVTQRRYRGFCRNEEQLTASIARIRDVEPRWRELLDNPTLPHSRARAEAGEYLARFFATVSEPKKLEKQIRRRCRGR